MRSNTLVFIKRLEIRKTEKAFALWLVAGGTTATEKLLCEGTESECMTVAKSAMQEAGGLDKWQTTL